MSNEAKSAISDLIHTSFMSRFQNVSNYNENREMNKNIDFNAKDSLGWTQLLKACINGHNEVVKLRIKVPKH